MITQTTYHYSQSTGCFYPSDVRYTDIPSDAVAATAAQFQAALARGSGDTLSVVNGAVTVVPYDGPTLAEAQAAQVAVLGAACGAAIRAGFASSALGAVHTYPASDTDQRNLIALVTASLLPNLPATWTAPFWCADSTGTWAMREHTASQIQKAGSDGQAAITALRMQNAKLAAEVAAAATVAAVQAIVWANPA